MDASPDEDDLNPAELNAVGMIQCTQSPFSPDSGEKVAARPDEGGRF